MSYFNNSIFKKNNFPQGQLKIHQSDSESNPSIIIGQNLSNTLEIKTNYNTSSNTLDFVNFTTKTTSDGTDGGKIMFNVDSVKILKLNDTGANITGNVNISNQLNIGNTLSVEGSSFLSETNIKGNLSISGSMNVGSTLKLQGSYLNFANTIGSSGYGFKDNSGTMQFKASGGSWANVSSGDGSITNLTSDGNLVEMSSNVNITGKLNIGGTLSISGDLNVSGNTTYSLKNGTRHLFGMNTKGFNAVEQQKLTASDASGGDYFGNSVSIYEDYALVGSHDDDSDRGSAYIFKRNGSTWTQQAKLLSSDGISDDEFGYSVSLYKDYALIGSWKDDDDGSRSGSAYIFKRNGSMWNQQTKLTASDAASNDYFGNSVSIYGDYALVGSQDDDTDRGSAYIFKRNGSTWTQQAKLVASDGVSNDTFGRSVSLYEDYALTGADGNDDNGSSSGSAYIFKRNGTTWTQLAKLLATDATIVDYFGYSISLYKDYALIGAPLDDNGSAYIFKRNGSTWTQQQKLTASDGASDDQFGLSVSLYEDYALIGALEDDSGKGSAYIFKRNGSTWTQQVKILASDGYSNDRFGKSISLYKNYALIGAYLDDDNGDASGSAYIFNITEDTLLLDNKPNNGTTIASFVSGQKMGIGTNNPDYKLHIEDYEPQIALKSTNDSHQEDSCRSEILFKDHNNYCLSKIVGQHEGSGNDSKGTLLFYTNPNLSYSLGLGMKIDNDQMTHMYSNVNISGSVNIKDSLKIEKSLSVGEKSYLSNVNIIGNLSVLGSVNIGGSLNIGNKVYISDGHISAEVKSFLIDHPTIEGKKLRHGCLEGPENGIYCRGTIVNSSNITTIHLTDYFTALVGNQYTINVTPHGPYLVYVKEYNEKMVLLESNSDNYGFDYFIIGQRSSIDIVE
jgi:predicted acyltransferase (DUF342 family)